MNNLKAYSDAQQEFLQAQSRLNQLRTKQHAMILKKADAADIEKVVAEIKQQVDTVNTAKEKSDAIERQIAEANIAAQKKLESKQNSKTEFQNSNRQSSINT